MPAASGAKARRRRSVEAGGGKPIGCCQAKAGYDWASGWGSLKIAGFAKLAAAAG